MTRLLLLKYSWLAKFLTLLSRLLGRGSGTSLPGMYLELYFKWLIAPLNNDFEEKIYLSGTNGKTTTRALLVSMYESQGIKVCTNRGGANIFRGIASSLLQNLDLFGRSKAKVLIMEVEEATLPILSRYIQADKLVLTNVFRDQLDAYGEVDKTVSFFRETLQISKPQIYLNEDDRKLQECLEDYPKEKIIGFGMEIEENLKPDFEQSDYNPQSFAEVFVGQKYRLEEMTQLIDIRKGEEKIGQIKTNLPGVFNLYNILAAVSAAYPRFGDKILDSVNNFEAVFGRGEQIDIYGKNISLMLVKNPAGFNQVLSYLHQIYKEKSFHLLVLINDRIADGKDVSWLWDVNLEEFIAKQNLDQVNTGGTRGLDMLLRFEYAEAEVKLSDNKETHEHILEAIKNSPSQKIVILCTYTALLDLRKKISEVVELKSINQKGF
jgi:UDP-N-acetylmuramyl tripeptide synthase